MPVFYFRNDDVNILDPELVNVTKRCTDEGIPLTHTIEPANGTDECIDWLLSEKGKDPRLVELMQHGYDHVKRDVGEFGGKRPYDDQFRDLQRGKQILREKLGDAFLPALNYPFGPYNRHSIRATDDLKYRILCSHYNFRLSRRLLYQVGHFLRRGQILDRHISYHLDFYPRTGLFCIDMAVSFIKQYLGSYGSRECVFFDLDTMIRKIECFLPYTPVIGILIHHRYHTDQESLDLISNLIRHLKTVPDAEFLNLEEIYTRFCPQPGRGFREADGR